MSLLLIKVLGSSFMAIIALLIVRKLVESDRKIFSISNLIYFLFMILPVCLFYKVEYNSFVLLLSFLVYGIVFHKMFRISFVNSILISGIFFILITLFDLLVVSIELNFIPYYSIRTNLCLALINNIIIGFFSYFMSTFSFLKIKIKNLCGKIDRNNYLTLILFFILIIIVITLLYYNIVSVFKLNLYYTITSISIVIFILLAYFYLDEKDKYQKLSDEYNILFDYVQDFENWIDDEQMYRHELKNNLSMLRSMTKNKKVIDKIDDMLKVSIIVDEEYIKDLKNVPKGGLKGLLYYKIAVAKNEKVQMIVDVSSKVTKKIERLTTKQIRNIGIVLGIYLDNAIEAAKESKRKQVTLEIYSLEEEVNFVISNTYEGNVKVEDMNKKGYTTKGKGHGKGLYYATKTIQKSKYLSTENNVLNDFFIQRLTVI